MRTGNGTRLTTVVRWLNKMAMYRIKQLFSGHLTLREYGAQVWVAMDMIRALNKMTRAVMPESVRIASESQRLSEFFSKSDLFNKAQEIL